MSCELTELLSIIHRIDTLHTHTHARMWNHHYVYESLMLYRLSNYINLRFLISPIDCPGVCSPFVADDFSSPTSKTILSLY